MTRITIFAAVAAAVALGACGWNVEGDRTAASIAPAELAARLETAEPPLVLDVRSEGEHDRGHIPGAVLVPHDELEARLDELPEDRSAEIVVHCQSGGRAAKAAAILMAAGYMNVRDLDGHWRSWSEAGLPTE
jgi:rhodanese-related sulfurtransferase